MSVEQFGKASCIFQDVRADPIDAEICNNAADNCDDVEVFVDSIFFEMEAIILSSSNFLLMLFRPIGRIFLFASKILLLLSSSSRVITSLFLVG
jgi:hypothetical protein